MTISPPDLGPDIRPIPPYKTITEAGRVFERSGRTFIEFPLDVFHAAVRGFVKCTRFDLNRYLEHNPGLREHSNPYKHWLEHGYFEGRLLFGWERLPFDLRRDLSDAPDKYLRLVCQAGAAEVARHYEVAERLLNEAVKEFPLGVAARVGLANLLFRTRKPLQSYDVLLRAIEQNAESKAANELFIDVLVDLGLHDLACEWSLRTRLRTNTALHVLRLLNKGDLARARHYIRRASDDWPLLRQLATRISQEWRQARLNLARLHAAIRKGCDDVSTSLQVDLAYQLARLGYRQRSRTIIASILRDHDGMCTIAASGELLNAVVGSVRINVGVQPAYDVVCLIAEFSELAPSLRAMKLTLAYQSGNREVVAQSLETIQASKVQADELEICCECLKFIRRFEDALLIMQRHWQSVSRNRWMPALVMEIGRAAGQYSGVSADMGPEPVSHTSAIPRRIIQFWDKEQPPDDVLALIRSWRLRNPGYEHLLFSELTATQFLMDHYGKEYAMMFDRCHHPAMKSDFFRLAYLTAHGGIYVDADEFCNEGIEALITSYPGKDLFASFSETGFFMNNRFICTVPGHPFLVEVLKHVVQDFADSIEAGDKPDIWFVTGPFQYSRTFAEYLLRRDRDVVPRIGLVYSHELSRYLSSPPLKYKSTVEGNWRAQ